MAKVLVLEDDKLAQKIVGRVLGNAGHETLTADSTQVAWDKLQEHVLVDMVVVDNQLDQEWGWQFLRMLRKCPAYQGLPVVVYSAHTERSSIIHYLELGVQSLHVKPYQSDVLLGELKKAVESKWTLQVMEPAETVCARLGLTPSEYGGVLAAANRTIDECLQVARRRLTSSHDTHLYAALASIEQQCQSVGIAVIEGVIARIKKSVQEEDLTGAYEGLQSVQSLLGMIRHRMLAVLKMNGSVARAALPANHASAPASPEPPASASFAASYAREIIGQPLWQYGPLFKRVLRQPLVTTEELQEMTRRVGATAPLATIGESARTLQLVQTMSVEEAAALAWETPHFVAIYQQVMERITGADCRLDSLAALTKVVGREGVAQVVTRVAVARVANRLPRGGPLNLRHLHAHTLAAAITAFEIGRLLKLANDYMLCAAGLAHDGGRWLLALGEPGAYALALALAEAGSVTIEEAETALFGMNHHQAGRQLLISMGQPTLLQEAAALHHDPTKVTDRESVITVTVIHLAHLLTQAAIIHSAVETKEILTRLRAPDYPAWALLKSQGASLTFDTPELVDTLAAIAGTSLWTAHQFLDHVG